MFWFNFLFIPANWNSYSKSDTALKPLKIIFDLYFLQIAVVKELKVIIKILLLLNFKSLNKAFLTISNLSSALKRCFFSLLLEIATITLSTIFNDFFMTSIWPYVMGSKVPG